MSNGQEVLEVHSSGTVKVRDSVTGVVVHQVDGPRDLSPTADSQSSLPQSYVTADAKATYTALLEIADNAGPAKIYVISIDTGNTRTIDEGEVAGIAYMGEILLVQRKSGDLETWTTDGSARLASIPGTPNMAVGPVTDGSHTVAEITEGGSAQIIDYPSGVTIGTLALPKGNKSTSTGLAFSNDGDDLVTATEANGVDPTNVDAGELVDWKMSANSWIHIACVSAGHDLTPDQWSAYMRTSPPREMRCER
jgi:WD40 repeat protein